MRQNILIATLLLLVLIFVGCESAQNYDACLNDPECYAEVVSIQKGVSDATTTTLNANPQTAPVSLAVGSVLGGIISFLVGLNKGKKIRKG